MKDFRAILTGFDHSKIKKPDIRALNAPNAAAAAQEDSDEDD